MAGRYVFRLEAVLRMRKRREDQRRLRVADQLRKVLQARNELGRIEDELGGEISVTRTQRQGPSLDVVLARRERGYIAWLERRRVEAHQALDSTETELRTQQALLMQASREVKVLEKLRERQQARAAQSEQRVLRIEEDEFAGQAYLRRTTATAD